MPSLLTPRGELLAPFGDELVLVGGVNVGRLCSLDGLAHVMGFLAARGMG
jgi:hypothetical protein